MAYYKLLLKCTDYRGIGAVIEGDAPTLKKRGGVVPILFNKIPLSKTSLTSSSTVNVTLHIVHYNAHIEKQPSNSILDQQQGHIGLSFN